MICPNCGQEIPDGSKFCTYCGASLMANQAAPSSPDTAVNPVNPVSEENSATVENQQMQASTQETPAQETPAQEAPTQEFNGAFNAQQPGQDAYQTSQQTAYQTYQQPAQGAYTSYQPQGSNQTMNYGQNPYTQMQPAQKKKTKTPLIIGIVAAVAAVVILAAVLIPKLVKPTVNLNNYVDFELSGVNEYGLLTAEFNYDKLSDDYDSKVKLTSEGKKKLGNDETFTDYLESIEGDGFYIEPTTDDNGTLSNGDTLNYKWSVDEDVEKYFKVRLNTKEGSYKVSGLKDAEVRDIFADVTITFEGQNGEGECNVDYLSLYDKYQGFIDFDIDKETGLSNGDQVTLTISDYCVESLAQTDGVVPEETSKTYTVEGLTELKTVDVFSEVNITVTGIDGAGEISFDYDDFYSKYDVYPDITFDKEDGLSNGDTVTATISEDGVYLMENVGNITPKETTMVYTISDLDTMLTTASGLTDDQLAPLKTAAEAYIQDYCDENNMEEITIKSMAYQGDCFLLKTDWQTDVSDYGYMYDENELGLVYQITYHISDPEESLEADFTSYLIANFVDVTVKSDGSLNYGDDVNNVYYQISTYEPENGSYYYTYYGIESLDAVRQEYTENAPSGYTSEVNLPQ